MPGKSREGALSDLLSDLGHRLKKARIEANFTQERAAQRMGVSSQTLRNWEYGRHEPTRQHLVRLAEVYQVDLNRLLPELMSDEFHSVVPIPIRGYLLAGSNEHPTSVQIGSIPLPEEILKDHPGIFGLLVSGDSLAHYSIRDGDMLLVDPDSELNEEGIQIVRVGDSLYARFVANVNGNLEVEPGNRIEDSTNEGNAHVVGRVVWHVRKI